MHLRGKPDHGSGICEEESKKNENEPSQAADKVVDSSMLRFDRHGIL